MTFLPPLDPAAERCARTIVLSNICTRCTVPLKLASSANALAHLAGLDPTTGPSTGYPPFETDWRVQSYGKKPLPDEIGWSEAASAYAAQPKRFADPDLYEHAPSDLSEIPETPLGDMIRLGRTIFTDTQVQRGTFVGSDLACSNC